MSIEPHRHDSAPLTTSSFDKTRKDYAAESLFPYHPQAKTPVHIPRSDGSLVAPPKTVVQIITCCDLCKHNRPMRCVKTPDPGYRYCKRISVTFQVRATGCCRLNVRCAGTRCGAASAVVNRDWRLVRPLLDVSTPQEVSKLANVVSG